MFADSIVTRGVTLSVVLISFGEYSEVTFQIVSASSMNICDALAVVIGIRSIERITGHHRDTIGRLLENMAEHAEVMNAYLKKNLELTPFKCDDLWSFVKKTKKR